jgi:putative transposase
VLTPFRSSRPSPPSWCPSQRRTCAPRRTWLSAGHASAKPVALTDDRDGPDGRWMAQQARNLLMKLDDRQRAFRFLIHDRDSKFTGDVDTIFRSEGIEIIRTPVQAPNANAHAERWVRTVRSERLDRALVLGRRHLEYLLRVYAAHYNRHRPHRSLALGPPNKTRAIAQARAAPDTAVHRCDLLGGLIHEYALAA